MLFGVHIYHSMLNPGPYIPHAFGDAVAQALRQRGPWVTIGVQHSIHWPRRDVLVRYDGAEYVLRGIYPNDDRRYRACVSRRATDGDVPTTLRALYRFASVLGWYKRGFVEVTTSTSGSAPIRCEDGYRPFVVMVSQGDATFNCNYMPIIRDELVHRALAFWREGKWLEQLHPPYAFLSFYKVIDSQFRNGGAGRQWIDAELRTLAGRAAERLAELVAEGVTNAGAHIWESGRCAIAHASVGREIVDPDQPADRVRLTKDLVVIRDLAETYIRNVLGVPDEYVVLETRDRLAPLEELLHAQVAAQLRGAETLPRRALQLQHQRVSIRIWPHAALPELMDLELLVLSAHDGQVRMQAVNTNRTIDIRFLMDFPRGRAHALMEEMRYATREQGGNLADSVALIAFRKAVFTNHIAEIVFAAPEAIVQCEVVIPVNVDMMRTLQVWQAEEDALRLLYDEPA